MRISTLTKAAALGAAGMYLFDPDRGRARRARLRDQCGKLVREADRSLDVVGRDMSNRIYGTFAAWNGLLAPRPADDATLAARVRSKLGRVSRHPSAIEVVADDGRVTLSGSVLAEEVQCIVRGVAGVPGVSSVENRLEVHRRGDDVDALQGGGIVHEGGLLPPWRAWSPTARFCAGLCGLAVFSRGMALPLLIGGTAAVLAVRSHPPRRRVPRTGTRQTTWSSADLASAL